MEGHLKGKNRTTIWPSNSTEKTKDLKIYNLKWHMYSNVHCSTIYNKPDMEAT